MVTDALIILLAMAAAYVLRFWIFEGKENMPFLFYVRSALLISPLFLLLFTMLGQYETHTEVLLLRIFQQIILCALACTAILSTVYFTVRSINVSRWLIFLFFFNSAFFLCIKRAVVYHTLHRARTHGHHIRFVLLAGSGRSASEYLRTVEESPWLGYQVLGNIGSKPIAESIPYLGPLSALDELLRDTSAAELVAALDVDELAEMDRIVDLTEKYGLKFSLIPYFAPYMLSMPYIDQVGSLPLINLRRIPLDNMFNSFAKRLIDIVGSLLLIVLTSPLMLTAWIGTRITLGKPVIFRQIRVGYQRKEFTMLKFRSMRQPKPDDKSGWSSYDENRLTRFGAFLRKTSIDELPQLFNVLCGTMSLVGPRPELPQYVDQFRETVPLYMVKHQVRPGMTGLAQVNGYRGDTSIEARIRLDIRYIETWSLLLDIKILFMTLFHFLDNGDKNQNAENEQNDRETGSQTDDGENGKDCE